MSTKDIKDDPRPLGAYDIDSFCIHHHVGRTKVWQERKAGRLKVRRVGKRLLITAEDAREWLRNLPEA